MKTHEFAKALRVFASLLEKAPNIRIEDVKISSQIDKNDTNQIGLSISALVGLANVGKAQLVAFIKEMNYPISIRPADAARDVIGKILSYLEKNQTAQEQLKAHVESSKESQASPELLKALSSLLKGSV